MKDCLGDVVAALVDGELDHPERERAQRHLAHCESCRAEVDGQRRLKARLSGLAPDVPPLDQLLTARLLHLSTTDSGPRRPGPTAPGAGRPAGRPLSRPVGRGAESRRPPGQGQRRRRTAAGTALAAALGLSAAFALGSPQSRPPSTPLDPGADSFVVEFVNTTADVPTARRTSLTNGGVGSGR